MTQDERDRIRERARVYHALTNSDAWRDYFLPEMRSVIENDERRLLNPKADWEETCRLRNRIATLEQVLAIPRGAIHKDQLLGN